VHKSVGDFLRQNHSTYWPKTNGVADIQNDGTIRPSSTLFFMTGRERAELAVQPHSGCQGIGWHVDGWLYLHCLGHESSIVMQKLWIKMFDFESKGDAEQVAGNYVAVVADSNDSRNALLSIMYSDPRCG